MPQTDSSATGDVMSKTPLNKGQSQVDIVPNLWRFRTIRDPFQENRSQRLEVIKGQKITPLREGICPLERQGRWLSSFVVVMDGTVARRFFIACHIALSREVNFGDGSCIAALARSLAAIMNRSVLSLPSSSMTL